MSLNNEQTIVRTANLLLPRLEAVKRSGDGALVHEVKQHLAMVKGWLNLAERTCKAGDFEVLESCCQQAEQFLSSLYR